jgi:hypothetical protein
MTRTIGAEGMTDKRVFSRTPRIEEAPLSDELMLFDPQTSKFFVLNRTMAFVWRRCTGEHPVARMVEEITREFEGVELETAAAELDRAIEELVSMGLVAAVSSEHRG